jgi:hypothetical protein
MRVVALVGGVFHVRGGDGDAARLLFRGTVDLVVRPELSAVLLGHHLRQRRRQRRLAMVNVTNGANVHVRLVAFEFFLGHVGCLRRGLNG